MSWISLSLALLATAPAVQAPTIEGRFAPDPGFARIEVDAYGQFLRRRPLKPEQAPVRLYDGRLKANQGAHVAVLDLDLSPRDLQQCADAAIRLRAEFQLETGLGDKICFRFTSGHRFWWRQWRDGIRPQVQGRTVRFARTSAPSASVQAFRRYLDTIFQYAGTASLARDLRSVVDPRGLRPGDVFVQGGYPGHAVIVMDVVENESGARRFLLGQSYMPAQEIHILKNPSRSSPWYKARRSGRLNTPEWRFRYRDLRRFGPSGC